MWSFKDCTLKEKFSSWIATGNQSLEFENSNKEIWMVELESSCSSLIKLFIESIDKGELL